MNNKQMGKILRRQNKWKANMRTYGHTIGAEHLNKQITNLNIVW